MNPPATVTAAVLRKMADDAEHIASRTSPTGRKVWVEEMNACRAGATAIERLAKVEEALRLVRACLAGSEGRTVSAVGLGSILDSIDAALAKDGGSDGP